ncbi:hypothetical protein [Methylobacterium persicinum]|uniref:Uncharacterized protein n=1 Tax=Methylobacterium persicinum TaxID=374426 RepID=A0ABU0HU56_9HYPH|nr:hypothetical protein [Methylobacterium persicinum]MDQ0445255.1 hypothetical protein [Methylobacterium persicinum]
MPVAFGGVGGMGGDAVGACRIGIGGETAVGFKRDGTGFAAVAF